ncbi:MAG: hypothetical protein HQL69_12260 [Magnetococcales bacterium]|nr:hypothetical protein [Magnetococcales bacterium]
MLTWKQNLKGYLVQATVIVTVGMTPMIAPASGQLKDELYHALINGAAHETLSRSGAKFRNMPEEVQHLSISFTRAQQLGYGRLFSPKRAACLFPHLEAKVKGSTAGRVLLDDCFNLSLSKIYRARGLNTATHASQAGRLLGLF